MEILNYQVSDGQSGIRQISHRESAGAFPFLYSKAA